MSFQLGVAKQRGVECLPTVYGGNGMVLAGSDGDVWIRVARFTRSGANYDFISDPILLGRDSDAVNICEVNGSKYHSKIIAWVVDPATDPSVKEADRTKLNDPAAVACITVVPARSFS